MKKLALLIICISAVGCSSDSEPENPFENLPYYSFTLDDKSKILNNPDEENTIVYRNQDDETIIFEVKNYRNKKTIYSKGSFFGNSSTDYYYYDKQHLILSLVDLPDISNQLEVKHERHPLYFNPNIFPHIKKASRFNSFLEFPFWNGYLGDTVYDKTIVLNFNLPEITMSFNGTTYNNVRIIESGKTEVISPQLNYPRNVNVLYYDTKFGIIGFDDLEGNSWRLD